MSLVVVASATAPVNTHRLCGTFLPEDFGNLQSWQRRRASLPLRLVTCSSSPPCPPQGVAAAAPHHQQEPSSSSSSSDFASFKPRRPALPVTPKELATDLPFQYWYSYADLPPGVPKRRPKNNAALTFKSGKNLDASPTSEKERRGGAGAAISSLWETALTVDSVNNWDPPKVGAGGSGGGGRLREAEKALVSTYSEKSLKGAADAPREAEIPLTEKEVKELVGTCYGTGRQINIGWDGWSPSYIALVHSYWKRSLVCKIKCKGAVTLDMDSICNKLEANTGGKVIHRAGGTLYLFRGRNYKYWRDAQHHPFRCEGIAPKFPKRLPVPCNLTKEDVNALRTRGSQLPALCKPGKHGVYLTLLDDVRKSFETQDLVRVNCQGFYPKNFKTLASKLQALVPCELISFEFEHILMWKRKDESTSNAEEVAKIQPQETCELQEDL